jgi:hypothetical protein
MKGSILPVYAAIASTGEVPVVMGAGREKEFSSVIEINVSPNNQQRIVILPKPMFLTNFTFLYTKYLLMLFLVS